MDAIKAAAQYLTELRNTGRFGARLPEASRPATLEDALKIQDRMIRVYGQEVGGFKCSVPTAERTLMAPIFAPTIVTGVPCYVRAATPQAGDTARIEPEIAFVLGRDLPPRATPYSEAEVRAAIGEVRLVLELLGSRYIDPEGLPFLEMLADCVSNQGLFLGPAVSGGLAAPLSEFALRIERTDGTAPQVLLAQTGKHPNGHPLLPLYWMANFQSTRGAGLRAGQIVTTGSYAGMVDVPLAAPLRIQFGDLGEIAVEFRRKED
jgi:2-keto-4-pentenoate hydratase